MCIYKISLGPARFLQVSTPIVRPAMHALTHMFNMPNNDEPHAHDHSYLPPDPWPDNRAAVPDTDGTTDSSYADDGAAWLHHELFELSPTEFEAWLYAQIGPGHTSSPTGTLGAPIHTTPDMCPCPPSSSHAPSHQTPFTAPDIPSAASPPSSSAAVPFCVSPTDTVFSPVPSLSSPGVSDSPNSLGPQSPVTPPLPIPAHAVFIASPDPWQFPMHLPTPALVMLDSPGILPNLPPGLPMYVLCGTPYTASDSSISAAIPVQPTAPATPQTSPLNVAPTTGPCISKGAEIVQCRAAPVGHCNP
ncbi:hypothetical protein L226DRAFT_49337 [Lentinus tigrinus ALCF2SS1-7]|uniref:uncharacterized protein n=1 Tax=Lentinus tigrinus ALCF2SS1-7 TaxID=1328758 RepID=UPI001165C8D8|nr:hypothetical protein L226DRAFT_49337 [Lentinus tigrinus ALCF2SS1-7]